MKVLIPAIAAVLAAPIVGTANFFADAASGEALPSTATLIVQLGLSVVFLWQWQSERKERAQAQDQLRAFLEKFAPTLAEAITVLQDVKTGLVSTIERVQIAPDRREYDMALRRMELLTSELEDMLRRGREERNG